MKITVDGLIKPNPVSKEFCEQAAESLDRRKKEEGSTFKDTYHINSRVYHLFESKYPHYSIVVNIFRAIQMRAEGKRVVSLREADIIARSKRSIEIGSLLDQAVMEIGAEFYFCEGLVGDPESPWEVRARYNRGLEWFKRNNIQYTGNVFTFLNKDHEAAIKIMERISVILNEHQLPLWPEEVSLGFHPEFLIPEYMTQEEYSLRRLQKTQIRDGARNA